MESLNNDSVDEILGLQLVVAWAGESGGEPRRLGWWQTDLVDDAAGGDFFKRLTPKTREWTALEAVRDAATKVDRQLRASAAEPESVLSLYHPGPEVDRALADRWSELKRGSEDPVEVLNHVSLTREAFDPEQFESWCQSLAEVDYRQVPGGRQLRGNAPEAPLEMAREFAAALSPVGDDYPMPHYKT